MGKRKTIEVFWLDDQHESMGLFITRAKLCDIILHPFTSSEEGLPVLEERLHFFDAVLFDARFFHRKDQQRGTEELDGLSEAIEKVIQLRSKKAFTPFILSGQESLEKDDSFKQLTKKYPFYRKSNPKDVQRLFKDIRLAAEDMADTQIRHRFHRVFNVCTDRYIGVKAAQELLTILRRENDETLVLDANNYITPIRKIMEDLFSACHREGLVPEAFITGNVALNETSKFLAGHDERGYRIKADVVPRMIAELLKNILAVAQPALHRTHVDEHMAAVRSSYLLYSVTYMLLDVLLWFKGFADGRTAASDKEELFIEVTGANQGVAEGIIEQDTNGNYHCGALLLDYRTTNENFKLGDSVVVTVVVDNTVDRTMEAYPQRAKRFRKA